MRKEIIILLVIVSLLIGFGVGKISERMVWRPQMEIVQKEINWLRFQSEMIYLLLPEEPDWLRSQLTMIYALPEEEIEEARAKLVETINLLRQEGEEIHELWGVVSEVGDSFLVMEGVVSAIEHPLLAKKQPGTITVKVRVSDKTEIFRAEESAKLFSDLKDIKMGDTVQVKSEEDINDGEEIIASQIQLVH